MSVPTVGACIVCGAEFQRGGLRGRKVFCSDACSRRETASRRRSERGGSVWMPVCGRCGDLSEPGASVCVCGCRLA